MSWEGFVIEHTLSILDENRMQAYFYKTSSENEIDLVLIMPNQGPWAVEIKRTLSPKFTKGYRIASMDIGTSRNFIIYLGTDRYPLEKNTEAISLSDFLKELQALQK